MNSLDDNLLNKLLYENVVLYLQNSTLVVLLPIKSVALNTLFHLSRVLAHVGNIFIVLITRYNKGNFKYAKHRLDPQGPCRRVKTR
jgi:hypothetical protein